MSAMYRQDPCGHGATARSSQSVTVAPVMVTRPFAPPLVSNAKIIGSPESLCVQMIPGLRRLAAAPLASTTPCSRTSDPAATHCCTAVWDKTPEEALPQARNPVTKTSRRRRDMLSIHAIIGPMTNLYILVI